MAKLGLSLPTEEQLLAQLIEVFRLNSDGRVTAFSKRSNIRGILYAIARTAVLLKGFILGEQSKLFLSSCFGEDLDKYALENYSILRRQASKSSAEVMIQAASGTVYAAGTTVKSSSGITFLLKEMVTVPLSGIAFAEVESEEEGSQVKVYANSIINMPQAPQGHISVTNLQPSLGGFDIESDSEFKSRLYSAPFNLSQEVPRKIEYILYTLFPYLSKVSVAVSAAGSTYIGALKTSGASLTGEEILSIKTTLNKVLNVSNTIFLTVESLRKVPVDVTFSVTVSGETDIDQLFRDIQIKLLGYLDFRYWSDSTVRSEVLISKVASIQSIIDLDASSFTPKLDIQIGQAIPFLRSLSVTFTSQSSGQSTTLGQSRADLEASQFSPNIVNALNIYISND